MIYQKVGLAIFMCFAVGRPAIAQDPVRETLTDAIWDEDVRTVAKLVKRLNNIDYGDSDDDPVLWQAVSTGNLQIVKVLVDAGASLDVREANWGMPIFNQAATTDELSLVEYLIRKGAKTDLTDKYGGNALEEAAFNGCAKIAERLKRLGLKSKFPLHVAAGLGDVAGVRDALARKADPNQLTGWKNSALFFAVGGGSAATTKLLLAAKARTDIKNVFGCTALHYAAAAEDQTLPKMLIDAGADVNASSEDGERPLDWASDQGVIRLLKAAGAKHGQ